MSWVAVGAAVLQTGYGIYQQQKGASDAKKAEAQRPKYQIPQSLRQAMLTSELRSLEGLPGDVKNEMRQQMDRSRMSSLAQINERRGGLGAIAQLEQKQQDSIRQVGLMDTQQRNQNLQNLQTMRGQMAQQEQQAWQWDEAQRYQAAAGTASAMQGAGLQNIAGGVTSIATVAASGAMKGKGKDTPTETTLDGGDSITARNETAGNYTVKPQDMQFVNGKWVPKEGAMSPYGETWDAKTGGWRDDAQVASYVNDDVPVTIDSLGNTIAGQYIPVPSSLTNQQLETQFPAGVSISASKHGVNVQDMEVINGTFYPKDGTIKETEDGTMVWSSDTGQWKLGGEDTPNINTAEVINNEGDVEIIDLNNNGVPDDDEILMKNGETIDRRNGNVLVTNEENAAINNNNDQINVALENSENINLSTNESSLQGQISESNQIASAKNYGVDRSNLELKDGNWVPKEGATSVYGDTWDSSIGGWRDDALTESSVYSDKKLSRLSNKINQGESELNNLIEEGKGLEVGTREYKQNIRKRDKLKNKLKNLEEKLIKGEESEGISTQSGIDDTIIESAEQAQDMGYKVEETDNLQREITKEMISGGYSGKGTYNLSSGSPDVVGTDEVLEGTFKDGELVEGEMRHPEWTRTGNFGTNGELIEGKGTTKDGTTYEGVFDGVSKVTRTDSDGTVTTGTMRDVGRREEIGEKFKEKEFTDDTKEVTIGDSEKETSTTTIPTTSNQSTLKTEIGKVEQMQEDFTNDGTIPKYREFKKAWKEQNPNKDVPRKKEFKKMFTEKGMADLKIKQEKELRISKRIEEDKKTENKYKEHVKSLLELEGSNSIEEINKMMASSRIIMNEDGESITMYKNNSDFENKENGEIVTIKELLETPGKERVDRILGRQQKKYRWGSDEDNSRRRNYVHAYGTREKVFNEDGSVTETITITAKNHPLYGKTYIRKAVKNPEYKDKKVIKEAASLLTEYTTSGGSPIGVTMFHKGFRDFDIEHITGYINDFFKNKDGSPISDEDKKRLIKEMEKLYGRFDSSDIMTVTQQ